MWQTIALPIAVLLTVSGILKSILKSICFSKCTKDVNLTLEAILITIGLSYIIWYCN